MRKEQTEITEKNRNRKEAGKKTKQTKKHMKKFPQRAKKN